MEAHSLCPECDALIKLHPYPVVGTRVQCPNCRGIFDIVSTAPLRLDWAFIEPLSSTLDHPFVLPEGE